MLEKGKGDLILHDALTQLPSYAPNEEIWIKIQSELSQDAAEQMKIKRAIAELPLHEAPDIVWENIEKVLPETGKNVRIFTLRHLAIAAASVGCILLATMWYRLNTSLTDSISYHYRTEYYATETDMASIEAPSGDEDEQTFRMVDELCDSRPFVCDQPQIQELKSQLNELNEATAALKGALNAYDDEPELRQQLMQLEQERTEVLKKIIAEI